jgi:hypothetical protein
LKLAPFHALRERNVEHRRHPPVRAAVARQNGARIAAKVERKGET